MCLPAITDANVPTAVGSAPEDYIACEIDNAYPDQPSADSRSITSVRAGQDDPGPVQLNEEG